MFVFKLNYDGIPKLASSRSHRTKSCRNHHIFHSMYISIHSFSRQIKNHHIEYIFDSIRAKFSPPQIPSSFVCALHIFKWYMCIYLCYILTLSKYKRFRMRITLNSNVCEGIEAHKFYDTKK